VAQTVGEGEPDGETGNGPIAGGPLPRGVPQPLQAKGRTKARYGSEKSPRNTIVKKRTGGMLGSSPGSEETFSADQEEGRTEVGKGKDGGEAAPKSERHGQNRGDLNRIGKET